MVLSGCCSCKANPIKSDPLNLDNLVFNISNKIYVTLYQKKKKKKKKDICNTFIYVEREI